MSSWKSSSVNTFFVNLKLVMILIPLIICKQSFTISLQDAVLCLYRMKKCDCAERGKINLSINV